MARSNTVLLRLALMIIGIAGFLVAGQDPSTQDVTLSQPIPIPPQPLNQPVPDFIGNPATPNPINARAIPQSPYMAPNGVSSVHLDAYQTDTYTFSGPLGRGPQVTSTFLAGLCGTVTFDFRGVPRTRYVARDIFEPWCAFQKIKVTDETEREQRMDLGSVLLMAVRGIPIMHYGDEQYLAYYNDGQETDPIYVNNGNDDPWNRPGLNHCDETTPAFKVIGALARLRKQSPAI
ncbi:MAG: hypothetical protein JO108_06850 [Acidobacteriaceae bacterium]|nr:hypothetical protein [Acidobacteriaceae bacterium]